MSAFGDHWGNRETGESVFPSNMYGDAYVGSREKGGTTVDRNTGKQQGAQTCGR